jgi:hypothetical protein
VFVLLHAKSANDYFFNLSCSGNYSRGKNLKNDKNNKKDNNINLNNN